MDFFSIVVMFIHMDNVLKVYLKKKVMSYVWINIKTTEKVQMYFSDVITVI